MWIMGLAFSGFGTILGSVNFITTIICMRAPGMTMFRMPIFTWNVLLTGVLVLLAFPVLAAALFALEADRKFGAHVFDAANGGALLWQHLFWFFGHPEVYIIALPFFGIISEVIPVFSRKPMFGYIGLVAATIAIAGLSVTVWAHHMYVTGGVLLPFFSFMTFLIAVPTGVKFFNWIGTMWKGSLSFETPMLWAVGFLITFTFGGLTGVILASPPMDFHVSDSYFVVAHFHYVIFGTVVFAMFSGFHFWWPKFTGKMLDERLGKITFWTLFVGFHGTFLVQHWLGAEGMPRRYADYLDADGFTALNTISTISSFLLGLSMLPFFYNVWKTAKYGKKIEVDDPWGYGRSLEWATSCPPPRHNFLTLPRIRSESPAFDLHHRRSPRWSSSAMTPSRTRPSPAARRQASEDPGTDVHLAERLHPRHGRRVRRVVEGAGRHHGALPGLRAGLMIGFYLAFTAKRVDAMAQDNKEADVADEAGELGFFSPHSWQPLSLAVGGAFAFMGVVFGWWLLYFSAPMLLIGLFGWVFEYYRARTAPSDTAHRYTAPAVKRAVPGRARVAESDAGPSLVCSHPTRRNG